MNLKSSSKSGFTLIELLVVMLILVILGIAGLPAIRENMIRARYAADAVPAISDIRTKVELYRYEHDHLPGMQLKVGTNKLAEDPTDATKEVSVSYENGNGLYIQTMEYDEGADSGTEMVDMSGQPAYVADNWEGKTDLTDETGDGTTAMKLAKDGDASDPAALLPKSWHVFGQIDVTYENLSGRFVKPYNFQYIVPYCRGQDYCWAVAVVGRGDGLPKGTAYAVLEYNNTKLGVKFLATLERYKVIGGSLKPLNFVCDRFNPNATYSDSDTLTELAKTQIVIANEVDATFDDGAMTADQLNTNLKKFRSELTQAGWKLE